MKCIFSRDTKITIWTRYYIFSCVNITFNFRGPYMKCLGKLLISFLFFSSARLNFNGVSRLRTEFSSLFHSLTKEGMNDEVVEESLPKMGLLDRCHYIMGGLLYFE